MGFSIFSALGGAAEGYNKQSEEQRKYALEQMRETSSRLQERFDAAVADRRKKKSEYEQVGEQLKSLGLSDEQALVILQQGTETAQDIYKRVGLAKGALGDQYDTSTIVRLTDPSKTGMTLQEGINNLIGVAATGSAMPEPEFKSRTANTAWERQKKNLESQYGMSYDTIRSIAYGNVERGELPVGEMNVDNLYLPEQLEIRRAQQQLEMGNLEIQERKINMETLGSYNTAKLVEAQSRARQAQNVANTFWEDRERETEKYNVDIQTAKNELSKSRIALKYYDEQLKADLDYRIAQAAKEEAELDSAGKDLLKLNDIRDLYLKNTKDTLEGEFAGMYRQNSNGTFTFTGGTEGQAAFNARKRQLQLNFLETMGKRYGYTTNVLAVFESTGAADVIDVPPAVEVDIEYTPESFKDIFGVELDEELDSTIFITEDGATLTAIPAGKYGAVKFVPSNQTMYWNGSYELIQEQEQGE